MFGAAPLLWILTDSVTYLVKNWGARNALRRVGRGGVERRMRFLSPRPALLFTTQTHANAATRRAYHPEQT